MRLITGAGAWLITAVMLSWPAAAASEPLTPIDALRGQFLQPPKEARPWVYWMWLSSNVSRAGITADLEAMQRVGIGGALIMDVMQGTPDGPMQFLDPHWQEMFGFAVSEAKRLGLEVSINDGAGYYGSGGPWITPELGMQSLYASETNVDGEQHFNGTLTPPRVPTDDPPTTPWWTTVAPKRRFSAGRRLPRHRRTRVPGADVRSRIDGGREGAIRPWGNPTPNAFGKNAVRSFQKNSGRRGADPEVSQNLLCRLFGNQLREA